MSIVPASNAVFDDSPFSSNECGKSKWFQRGNHTAYAGAGLLVLTSFTGLGVGYALGAKALIDSYSVLIASGVGLASWCAGNAMDIAGINDKEKKYC